MDSVGSAGDEYIYFFLLFHFADGMCISFILNYENISHRN